MDIDVQSVSIPGVNGFPAPSIKEIHSLTFADIPQQIIGRALVTVAADETNDGLSSLYYFDGAALFWIPLV